MCVDRATVTVKKTHTMICRVGSQVHQMLYEPMVNVLQCHQWISVRIMRVEVLVAVTFQMVIHTITAIIHQHCCMAMRL